MRRLERMLVWAPVLLLPTVNIIHAILTHAPHYIFVAWIIGSAMEELFFRLFLLKCLFLPRLRSVLAIIIVSILFAGIHLWNLRGGQPIPITLVQMFFAFSFAIWAGVVTWKYTWMIPLLAHLLLNATASTENIWVSLTVGALVLADGVLLLLKEDKGEQSALTATDI